MANQGPNFGLHRDCRIKAQAKFDLGAAVAALRWMESILGRRLGDLDVGDLDTERDVADLLKDGTALCEVMNHIKPGAIKKYHKKPSAFQQMENAELFVRACVEYGMQSLDTFHVKELYEARAVYTVVNCIHALGSLAQQHGYTGPRLGVKLASRNERHFNEQQLQQARSSVGRQYRGPTDAASQAKMTPYGLSRQIMPSGSAAPDVMSTSHGFIGLQYGSNQVASQCGMTPYGMPRQIATSTSSDGDPAPLTDDINHNHVPDTTVIVKNNPILTTNTSRRGSTHSTSSTVIGLQYGSNKAASQAGMTAYGMPRQIVASTSSATSQEGEGDGEGEKGDVFEGENKT
ncbi:myophilin-like [Littorina saxatilis]|uniref:Transgelin n=1 Tax=Littorina saxatilis TaxID=31220 RepID=A0AAN9BB48_9CAEN